MWSSRVLSTTLILRREDKRWQKAEKWSRVLIFKQEKGIASGNYKLQNLRLIRKSVEWIIKQLVREHLKRRVVLTGSHKKQNTTK